MYILTELLGHITHRRSVIAEGSVRISVLAYDTRKVHHAENSLFFALMSQRDGHAYLSEAYAKGIRNFVVSRDHIDIESFPNSNFIWVNNTMEALQEIAIYHRNQFTKPVIGITGSNGKTIVKEWLHQLLTPDYNCYQSPKSYNSQLGVALSLWNLNSSFDLAIIEAGISLPGEMDKLATMIQPTIGVFTSLGTAHQEGFVSQEQKFHEKWKLFSNCQQIIAPSSVFMDLEDDRLLTWGTDAKDTIQIVETSIKGNQTILTLYYCREEFRLTIPFVDRASIDNVLTCVTVMFHLGYSSALIQERIAGLKPLEMRLKLKRGKNHSSIIDDSYSNDLASLQIALDFLNQQNQFKSKKIILSDFEGEIWNTSLEQKLKDLLQQSKLDEMFFIGNCYDTLAKQLPNAKVFSSVQELITALEADPWYNATVLIKGARKYQLEKLIARLVEQSHETVLEINLKSIEHNIQQYRAKINPSVKIMAMVKAFSYGSGSFEVANVLQFNKIDYLTVAFVDEGVALRKAGIQLPIMVLSPHESTFEDLVSYRLEPEIYSARILNNFISFLGINDIQDYPIHIKLDTGMHRLGFMPEEVNGLLTILVSTTAVRVASTFSHLVGAGDPTLLDFTRKQIALFKEYAKILEASIGYSIIKHICNTSGIIHHPEAHLDMVRLGIGLYGFDMAPKDIYLEEVSQLKTTISQIKHLKKGETVGYDRKGVLFRDSTIATVKIGYADGYNRRFGNGVGKMMIKGQLVSTIGNICMDMCMLDITDIKAQEGEEVIVFPDIALAAKEIGTIPYELLTGISSRVKRVYFYE